MNHPLKDMGIAEIRAAAIVSELGRAASEYQDALREFEITRQRLEVAKEKFAGVRRLAPDVLSPREWSEWQYNHEDLWLVGMDIGEAIRQTLHIRATSSAMESLDSKGEKRWDPSMATWEVVEALVEHGFEFRTATPRREVHAALLHLKSAKKMGEGRYALKEADAVYSDMKNSYEAHGIRTTRDEDGTNQTTVADVERVEAETRGEL